MPTRRIIAQLPKSVRYIIVDAAQSYANCTDKLVELGATHVGASLHKWLGAPIGTGLLYVKKDRITETWPLYASDQKSSLSAIKFEHYGTRNLALLPCVDMALEFHNTMGVDRKRKYLTSLADYFIKKIKEVKDVDVLSPRHELLKSNIIMFRCSWINEPKLHAQLWHNYKIHLVHYNWQKLNAMRISFNVFHNKQDVDYLIQSLKESKVQAYGQ